MQLHPRQLNHWLTTAHCSTFAVSAATIIAIQLASSLSFVRRQEGNGECAIADHAVARSLTRRCFWPSAARQQTFQINVYGGQTESDVRVELQIS